MDLHNIEEKLSSHIFIKEVALIVHNGSLFAVVHPDFNALKEARIINIEEEIRWYAIELYNMQVQEPLKIKGYKILTVPLPKTALGGVDLVALRELISSDKKSDFAIEDEPDDKVYATLKEYLSTLTKGKITPSSHLELTLGLDSLDYVELFVFIEESFGVKIDEAIFSSVMKMGDLYLFVKQNAKYANSSAVVWEDILHQKIDEKLVYSPIIISLYKTVLYPLFRLYFRLEVSGVENIPTYPCIIAPSHQSMLDGFLIESVLPYKILKKSFFLAYKQVFGTTLLAPVSKHGQTILIDANINLKHTMQYCALPLREGNNLVIFPEGARTRDRKLLEFRPFFAMLSKTFGIPVVPVVIDGSYEALQAGKIFPRPRKIRVAFLKPIAPDGLSSDEITQKVREMIEIELGKSHPKAL
ncbi:MAG: 1-acyl-sn-glycerol-3-phosphate acyltransferase [Sulfurimonas sp.]|uniref:1-acyl-sn-glycerol-3-phosphate acyltransferase n=1 Tax=Sulfurimonas sp. TaxID=2022749 RepID=UPI002606808A|nr:1-acyl-sn-glycerol-3-phosphate acyltransferase [Sulfurimonas sp.]MDD2652300.1 1-acyl-sn-glycerol-3-phosphate acyltransferase [Sulfurimonas sp.]MDD3451531.1 1-acyl-sn-glycerol-3-phosphate acyltransferase [Sulfurimonas sp.]